MRVEGKNNGVRMAGAVLVGKRKMGTFYAWDPFERYSKQYQ